MALVVTSSRSGRSVGAGAAGTLRPRGRLSAWNALERCSGATKPSASFASGDDNWSMCSTRWKCRNRVRLSASAASSVLPLAKSASAFASWAATALPRKRGLMPFFSSCMTPSL